MISIRDLLQSAADKLKRLESASLDCEVLLSYVLNKPREYILAHPEDEVADKEAQQFHELVERRAKHEPIAYLIKQKEFYKRNFYIDERVHIPRPSTEDLINCVKELIPKNFSGSMVDIGTGSGCIAVTLALEYPNAKIIATDISAEALAVARHNAETHGVDIIFHQGNLLEPLTEPADIIVANLPYGWPPVVRSHPKGGEGWTEDSEVFFQPKISYEAGADGLDAIKRLLDELPRFLKKGGQAFIEFDPRHMDKIKHLAKMAGFDCKIKKDSAGFDRIARLLYDEIAD